MAIWDLTSATSSLRSLLGDGASDKYSFKDPVYPTPDGVTRRFFVGQTRLVEGSLEVYVVGEAAPSGTVTEISPSSGTFSLASAPAPSHEVLASFYYQWFTDAELADFLTDAVSMITGAESVVEEMPVGLRPAVLQFAAYNAFMRKAAEFAEAIEASAGGYTFTRGKAAPNWKALADAAMKNAQDKLKIYIDNPLGKSTPAMRFVAFGLQRYQGN